MAVAEHPPQPWDSRKEGRAGEGRAREGKREERGGERGGSKAGRRGTRRRRGREEWQAGEIKQQETHSKDWASFTPTTQHEDVLSTCLAA